MSGDDVRVSQGAGEAPLDQISQEPEAPEDQSPRPQPKQDPESFVLRGAPAQAIRFRKSVIIAGAGLAAAVIASAGYYALRPVTFGSIMAGEGVDLGSSRPPEELAGAPSNYGDVPKLGPPLPGDLGRPILEQQRSLEGQLEPPSIDPAIADAEARAAALAQAEGAERHRLLAERMAARQSAVMMSVATLPQQATAPAPNDSDGKSGAADGEKLALDPDHDPGSQQTKADFLKRQDKSGDINPHALQSPVSPWTLTAGSVISASMVTGLNSDLPGLVVAQVTENAYDSVTGRTLLLPQGSRLIGSYDSVVAFGQNRALLVWQRIILPDGSSIRIDNLPASDASGYAGLADKVDLHTWSLLKGIALSTLLGVGTEITFGSSESDLVRALRESTQQSTDRAGQRLVEKNLSIQPTIKVRPGWPLRIVVHKDIILKPWRR